LTHRNVKQEFFEATAFAVAWNKLTVIDCTSILGRAQMNTNTKVCIAMLAGLGLGAGAVHELHAQASPPAYVISEIDVVDVDGYAREYLPLANKALASAGQKRLASSIDASVIAGEPLKSRIVLSVFENLEKAQAAYASPDYLEAQKTGEKFARFRIFAIEGATP
jgi:uncharacterized protein (DUF1330 family)